MLSKSKNDAGSSSISNTTVVRLRVSSLENKANSEKASRSNSIEKPCQIHPEITLEQLQNAPLASFHNKRLLKRKAFIIEKENRQKPNRLASASMMQKKQVDRNIDSDIQQDLLEFNTMFNFEPGSHGVIKPSRYRQRRNSTTSSIGSKIGLRTKKVGDGLSGDIKADKRRFSIASIAEPVKTEAGQQQQFLYERLRMIDSMGFSEGES